MPGPTRPKRDYQFAGELSIVQLTAIGRIAVEAAELEALIELAIWRMLGLHHDVGGLFTTRQGLEAKVKTFIRVAQRALKDKDIRIAAGQIAGRLRDSSTRRNDVIHSIWDAAGATTRRLGDKAVIKATVPSDETALNQLAADLHSDWLDLMAFLVDAGLRIADDDNAPQSSH
jgi:hypothetical protein